MVFSDDTGKNRLILGVAIVFCTEPRILLMTRLTQNQIIYVFYKICIVI